MYLNRFFTTTFVLLIALGLAACSEDEEGPVTPVASSTIQSEEDQVRTAALAWDDAFNAGDLARIMNLYANEIISMPPNLPAREGKAALQADFEYLLGEFDSHHETSTVGVMMSGDLAIERGRYTMTLTPKAGGETITEVGKHVMVRQKIGDEWKIVWEIWNTDE
ncbi:YybH family protein [Candidatus Poribacteria bacterium]